MSSERKPSLRTSITSSPSFDARFLQAEIWRLSLMIAAVLVLLSAWTIRHALHGSVAYPPAAFMPIVISLVVALVLHTASLLDTRRRARRGLRLPGWRLVGGTAVDLGLAFSILVVLHIHSPPGTHHALSAPALLIVPMVLLLSVLRLRPWYPLLLGLCAAYGHWLLVWDAFNKGNVPIDSLPMLVTYGVLFILTGFMGAALTHIVRRYITEAVAEAEAAERAAVSLAALERELELAREIQMGLLPSTPPKTGSFDVAGMARPATQAGGDLFDWQPLDPGRLIVAIADVTGHGIGSALMMAVCRAYFRALIPRTQDTKVVLEQINALVSKDLSAGRFITMAVTILSETGEAELLSAGHGPTFLYRAVSNTVEQFGGNGLPLGVTDDERYSPTLHTRLEPGDLLVLLTDGFTERSNAAGELLGADRIIATLIQHAGQSSQAILDALDAVASRFANGTPQSDDMTAVVVKRRIAG